MKEVISIFPKDIKEGKKQLIERFVNNVMEEETRVHVSAMPYEGPKKEKGTEME